MGGVDDLVARGQALLDEPQKVALGRGVQVQSGLVEHEDQVLLAGLLQL